MLAYSQSTCCSWLRVTPSALGRYHHPHRKCQNPTNSPINIPSLTMTPAERFQALAAVNPVVDTHNDFPYLVRVQLHYETEHDENFTFGQDLTCHTDLAKLRRGRVGVQFFSCFIECKADALSRDFNEATTVVRDTLEQVDFVRRLIRQNSELRFAPTAQDALAAFNDGKLAIAMGVEGLHQVDTSLAVLRQYFDLGVRYITLTHNCDNPFATAASSVAAGLDDRGLSEYGHQCIREMNRLGMMVDLSHVSVRTMEDALAASVSPVIFSHLLAAAVTPHPRNVPDHVLDLVKKNGGVVCVNFFPVFITRTGDDTATIDDAVAHILHIAERIGWQHVGLGSDFDGMPEGPVGLEDVSKYPDLIQRVMECSNVSDTDIALLMGGNVMRVWQENERMAHEIQGVPVDTTWSGRRWEFYEYARHFPEVYPGSYGRVANVYKDTQDLDFSKFVKAPKK